MRAAAPPRLVRRFPRSMHLRVQLSLGRRLWRAEPWPSLRPPPPFFYSAKRFMQDYQVHIKHTDGSYEKARRRAVRDGAAAHSALPPSLTRG